MAIPSDRNASNESRDIPLSQDFSLLQGTDSLDDLVQGFAISDEMFDLMEGGTPDPSLTEETNFRGAVSSNSNPDQISKLKKKSVGFIERKSRRMGKIAENVLQKVRKTFLGKFNETSLKAADPDSDRLAPSDLGVAQLALIIQQTQPPNNIVPLYEGDYLNLEDIIMPTSPEEARQFHEEGRSVVGIVDMQDPDQPKVKLNEAVANKVDLANIKIRVNTNAHSEIKAAVDALNENCEVTVISSEELDEFYNDFITFLEEFEASEAQHEQETEEPVEKEDISKAWRILVPRQAGKAVGRELTEELNNERKKAWGKALSVLVNVIEAKRNAIERQRQEARELKDYIAWVKKLDILDHEIKTDKVKSEKLVQERLQKILTKEQVESLLKEADLGIEEHAVPWFAAEMANVMPDAPGLGRLAQTVPGGRLRVFDLTPKEMQELKLGIRSAFSPQQDGMIKLPDWKPSVDPELLTAALGSLSIDTHKQHEV